MPYVRFLDGPQAGTTTLIEGDIAEGQQLFHGSELTTDRHGTPYYLKPVPRDRWAHEDVPEWTAALDTDPDDI